MAKEDNKEYKLSVTPLQGVPDFPIWRRNAPVYLTLHGPLLLCLEREPTNSTPEEILEWKTELQTKATQTLLISTAVQIRSITIFDDPERTAYGLRNFLETTYTASNEQAVQNLRVQIDKLVYIEEADWNKHPNEFNSLIAQLAVWNISID